MRLTSGLETVRKIRAIGQLTYFELAVALVKIVYYKSVGATIVSSSNVKINGLKNIHTKGELRIGIDYVGFHHPSDKTILNIKGILITHHNVSIGRGCRFDIGHEAKVVIGENTYINPFSKFIVMHYLSIGANCAISWDCQFLDEDFHKLSYQNKTITTDNGISIGNHVWIGTKVCIYKGSQIADGCVVASNSVVKGVFEEPNALIAGNPAKIVKRDVSWQ